MYVCVGGEVGLNVSVKTGHSTLVVVGPEPLDRSTDDRTFPIFSLPVVRKSPNLRRVHDPCLDLSFSSESFVDDSLQSVGLSTGLSRLLG